MPTEKATIGSDATSYSLGFLEPVVAWDQKLGAGGLATALGSVGFIIDKQFCHSLRLHKLEEPLDSNVHC